MSAAAFLGGLCTRRLVTDLREVLRDPLPDVVALPKSDDLRVWHGNVRSNDGCLGGAPIHFLVVFPETYPQHPPEIRLFQAVPHPNVRPAQSVTVCGKIVPRQARWRLAMWDCVPDTSTWSSAYTMSSILLQLQVFLLREDLEEFEGLTAAAPITAVVADAAKFACPHCTHTPEASYPAFLTDEHLASTQLAARHCKKLVARPTIPKRSALVLQQLAEHQQPHTGPTTNTPAKLSATAAAAATPVAPAAKPTTIKANSSEWSMVSHKKGSKPAVPGAVHGSKASKGPAGHNVLAAGVACSNGNAAAAHQAPSVAVSNKFSMLLHQSAVKQATQGGSNKTQPATAAATAAAPATAVAVVSISAASMGGQKQLGQGQQPAQMSKTAKKNLARKLKRQQQQGSHVEAASTTSTTCPPTPTAPAATAAQAASGCTSNSGTPTPPAQPTASLTATNSTTTVHSSEGSEDAAGVADDEGWTAAASGKQQRPVKDEDAPSNSGAMSLRQQVTQLEGKPHSELIEEVLDEWHGELEAFQELQQSHTNPYSSISVSALDAAAAAAHDDQVHGVLQGLQQPMGLFSCLAREDLLAIMGLLRPLDVARLASTCRGLRAAAQDGALWQALLHSHYPANQLAASRMSDWQTAYKLEANNVLDDLKCFYTRASFEEDVLCLPLNYTINPRTKAVDYIEAYPECIALSAFTGGVDRSSNQEPIKAVLPLYISAEHFARAQPYYTKVLRILAPEHIGRGGTHPLPTAWLEVLPKILNTCVVLLCDHGHAASHKALTVYVAVHRLLLAMCEVHNLWPTVRHRLDYFLGSPAARSKEACANLGLLLPLLALSRTHTWAQLGVPLLEESMARGVMWMCKAKPALEKRFTAPRSSKDEVDNELLASFETARVSTRLMMFHLAFLHLVGAPAGCRLETVMDGADALYGHPGSALGARFLRAMDKIMQVKSWVEYFGMLGMPMSEASMTAALKAAWARSCKRGYTYKGMDYSKIQASGVSKILLKGQSYTAPPGMKSIELRDVWKWRPSSGTKFLDASILLYSYNGSTRRFIEAIDYCHTISECTATPGAVVHSGDMMEDNQGTHTVQIDLAKLGSHINEMYVVVSAWAGATLSEIVQPFVQVCDPATGMALCEYHLEDQAAAVRKANSSVIMARIYRPIGAVPITTAASSGAGGAGGSSSISGTNSSSSSGSGRDSWKVLALGLVGGGCAGSYRKIQSTIEEGRW